MDLIQTSKVFWDVDAVSVGNVVHYRTPNLQRNCC